MRLLEPPGWPWLLRHELRIAWRGKNSTATKGLLFLAAVGWALLHVVAWFVTGPANAGIVLRAMPYLASLVTAFVALMILSLAFGAAVLAIFDRGDLDLLGSAPLPPATFYAVRALGVALSSVVLVAYLWMPFAHTAAMHGRWRMLLGYPALAGFGLAIPALALAGTLALARVFGARRARVLAQVAGAFAGAAMVLATQAQALLPQATRDALAHWVRSDAGRAWLGDEGPLGWLAHALLGEGLAPFAAAVGGAALFVLVIAATQRAFLDAAQRGQEASGARRSSTAARRFHGGLARTVVRKELLIIARDPVLIGRALLQVLYLLPLLAITVRRTAPLVLVAPATILIASSVAGSLAWIAVSGEEAPDLLRSAPLSQERLRWLKAFAAVLPVAALMLPFIAWYALSSVGLALVAAFFALAALAASAMIQVWTAKPAPARDLRLKPKGHILVNFVEMLTGFAWAGACYLALRASVYAILPALAGCLGPLFAWTLGRRRAGN